MADWTFLTRLYRQAPVAPQFLTKQIKNIDFSPLPKVNLYSESNSLTLASLGKVYDPPTPVNLGVNLSSTLVDPAQIYEYDDITEEMIFSQNYNPIMPDNVIASKDYLYAKKVAELKRRVYNRIEWMLAQVISTGAIAYNDGDRAFSVSYGVSPVTYTLASTTKVVSDLRSYVKAMKQNGFSPTHIFVTDNVEKALWDNTQFKAAVDTTTFNVAQMRYDATEPFVNFVAEVKGLPPIYNYGGNIGGSDLITGNKIILVDFNALGIAYGAIVNANLDPQMNPIAADAVSWEENTNHGASRSIFVMSRPLPYILNAGAVKILTVTISQ